MGLAAVTARLRRWVTGSAGEASGAHLRACDLRRDVHFPNNVTRAYGTDKSGTVLYEFNSKGYRGEEYNASARFRICVIGESNAFGTGLRFEETFGYKLKQHIAASLELRLDAVNLINLSVGGASADYCVRTLYRQLPHCEVDLLVIHLPHPARTEYIDGLGYQSYNVRGGDFKDLENAPVSLLGFLDYYNPHLGRLNQVKNALLAQAFLKERRIDYVIATQHLPRSKRRYAYLKGYLDRLDIGAILWHEYFVQKADLTADNFHAGRRSHAAFAIELLSRFGRLLLQRGKKTRGRKIASYASGLRATDEDWKYCNAFMASTERGERETLRLIEPQEADLEDAQSATQSGA